jgi:hypothetical protein
VAARAIGEAERALRRARAARSVGDARRAELLENLAGQWAASARDLARADDEEQMATELERQLLDVQEKHLRARALLEETVARVGRARVALGQLESASHPEKTKDGDQ